MKYLITGANGFVARNLGCRLRERPNIEILKFSRSESAIDLEDMVSQSDCIFHLAGENRPSSPELFSASNVQLTARICELLEKSKKSIPLIFASSKQAALENPYGISKLAAEEIIIKYAKRSGNTAVIYRLPGIFGKWGKPNYNSVVSTFCHNIAHGIPISIFDAEKSVDLVYIDDVVNDLIVMSESKNKGVLYRTVLPEYQITLGNLAKQLLRFKELRNSITIEPVEGGITGALYSTFLSYLPKQDFSYEIKAHQDVRGTFVEMIRAPGYGQVSYFTALPGVTRGGHFHHSKSEKFLVVRGSALFQFRNIVTDERYEITIIAQDHKIIDSVPGWAHSVKNVGTEELIVMLWANETYDKRHPDTIKYEL
jgi:UDP-2-acetamido-2,6-beta-L-arabino-hexul-4-ose reductase